jgi:DNA-directed RNA polymerase
MNEQAAIDYLQRRIDEEVQRCSTSDKAVMARGIAALLELFDNDIPDEELGALAQLGLQVVEFQCHKAKSGECRLTQTSILIGQNVCNALGENIFDEPDMPTWEALKLRVRHICIGDLVLETLHQIKSILIERSGDGAYVAIPLYESYELSSELNGTRFEPQLLNWLVQDHKRPVIKRWNRDRGPEFRDLLDTPHMRALDKMQQQGWKVNKKIYETLLENYDRFTKVYVAEDDSPEELLRQTQSESKARDFKAIMNRASKLRDEPEFYQFVECDYRGRVYYSENYFNFQGSDVARGMMLFNKPKRVTEKGLRWLAIHTACSYNESYSIDSIPLWTTADYRSHLVAEGLDSISVDKFTMEDRRRWTYMNMDKVLDTARDSRLHDCEKPISFLACAYEWEKYHENQDYFYSALPIPIDGSNNGWQHLAAISKDPEAGRLVGLVPVEIQEDFYVKTAKALIDRMPDWFEERDIPMKHIRKGISKRGSMTRAYSAGAQKIAENMYLDCRTEGFHDKYNIDDKDCMQLSRELIGAIDLVCYGPLITMKYLQKLADVRLNETDENILYWTTPSGFPVEYHAPYTKREQIKNSIRGIGRITHRVLIPTDRPDKQKFMSGISPNFIHSLDASHMTMVIDRWDGAFGGVHDSFSTHADEVDELQQLTKEVFIEMYTSDNNYEDIKRILRVETDLDLPHVGSLDINEVNNSDYFFA